VSTTLGALAAGVPVVAVPMFADQFDNSRLVAAFGAGLVVEAPPPPSGGPMSPADALSISSAIATVLADGSYRRKAGLLAQEMAAAPTADDILAGLLSGSGPR
jgi:UDP:flavonoid glycosyltransferase YjiC (YdhE family)